MQNDGSLLGLEREDSFLQKLGTFLAILTIGPLIGLLILAALSVNDLGQAQLTLAYIVIEILATFWLVLLVFIWWRPKWLRSIYLSVERKAIRTVQVIGLLCTVWIGCEILIGHETLIGLLKSFRLW